MNQLVKRFTMNIVKTSVSPSGERKIRMSASDVSEDFYGERMSTELFHNFVKRIEEGVGGVWKSVITEKSGWSGGMPYASISHYHSGDGMNNVPADIQKVYVDGDVLKSMAVVRNTELGDALWHSLRADADGTSDYEEKIRVSIGFIDLKHKHGDFVFTRDTLESKCAMCENNVGNKTYLDGILVHEAFTRVPANPRTSVEVDEMTKEIETREDDAESIVGRMADKLEVERSALESAMVVKSEEIPAEAVIEEACKPKDKMAEEDSAEDEMGVSEDEEKKKKVAKSVVVEVEKSEVDLAFDVLKSKMEEVKSLPKQDALTAIQPAFEDFGTAIQNSFVEPEVRSVVASIDPALGDILRSLSAAVEGIGVRLSTLSDDVTVLKSQRSAAPVERSAVVQPRNIPSTRTASQPSGKPLSIKELSRISTMGG